ncbi:MAG TPA: ATP-binding cassette domain-containing protein [Bryobacteraceae bacterium]|nr:ATP-binding cassette domain-containing protein [Bryobacteraceae bacterium]
MTNSQAAIRLENISKSFGSRTVLRDVSFDVDKGSVFCILGRSGTGKSVTLKLIVGLLHADDGQIYIGDHNITGLNSRALVSVRKSIGFLFQNAALFDSISVGENVAFPLRRHTDLPEDEIHGRAQSKLEQVGLGKEYDKMPADLSGGMKKRAGLARALALDPAIVLVDEPSAGLDPITSSEIDELLVNLKSSRDTTLVVVTHNIPSARRIADELIMLHEGGIIARGSVEEMEQTQDPIVQRFMASEDAG